MKKSWIILLAGIILVINLNNVLGEVRINEVMPDPSTCSDTDCEYIEIYSTTPINLTNWMINTGTNNVSFNFSLDNYLIITRNKNIFITNFLVDEDKVIELSGISLSNNAKDYTLLFNNNSELIYNFSYNESTPGISWQFCSGTWLERNPTPGYDNNCSISSTPPPSTSTPELSLDMTWDEDDIINGLEEFDIDVIAKNFDNDETYDVKVWIEFEDNNTMISQTYDENDTWVSSDEYYNEFFENIINKTKSITLRIKDNYKTYYGDAIIKLRLRKTGSSTYVEEISKDIEILEKDEDNETQTEEVEETSQEVVKTNNSEIKKIIKLGSSLEMINKTNLKINSPVVYESSNEKIKKYAVFGFAGLCLIITILALFNKLS